MLFNQFYSFFFSPTTYSCNVDSITIKKCAQVVAAVLASLKLAPPATNQTIAPPAAVVALRGKEALSARSDMSKQKKLKDLEVLAGQRYRKRQDPCSSKKAMVT